MNAIDCLLSVLTVAVCAGAIVTGEPGRDDSGWVVLIGDAGLEHWRQPTSDWLVAGDARLDAKNPKRLVAVDGSGVLLNGKSGKTKNLLSKRDYQDVEAHFEFVVPKGANSGVKFEALYEIQIFDSFGVVKPKATDCGGIYPRAELLPIYRHIDAGIPPRVNAARNFGEWQTLDVIFRAPRFDSNGKKTRNARFDRVVLNGEVIHENVELVTPTGHAWRRKEVARGPILLQGDHGPVAFRNIRVKPLE
jgi:hypothetical protein